ncbi:MOSC domain-containing protein [Sphingobium sp. SCG-1]|uniref:MOSC domain-containing protein n=1 Tax=Sphingobium sp. SCG-1 TaxID=2072936 RepID=UPI0039835381
MSISALLTGQPVLFRDQHYSAIGKVPRSGLVRLNWSGFEGDAVADPVHHGGWDKAIHLYPQEHYPFWREIMPEHDVLGAPGAFGENIASKGMTELDLCIGDRFSMGSAIVEVSHGRQPCWKLNHRFGAPGIMSMVISTGRAGVYFRVVREGEVEAETEMALIERPLPEWTVARVFTLLIAGGHRQEPEAVRTLAGMTLLAEAWRQRARKLAAA